MDLNAPLGMEPPSPSRRGLLLVAAASVTAIVGAGLVFVLATADPHGGEPSAVASLPLPSNSSSATLKPLERASGAARSAAVDSTPTGSLAPTAPATEPSSPIAKPNHVARMDEGELENGVRIYRGMDGASASGDASRGPLVIDVTRTLDDPLRRTHATTPTVRVGTPEKPAAAVTPRVAIFIGGMGLSQSATKTAIESMPPGVTLAFLPYGATVAASVDAAKAKGHEVLLQLPMQNGSGGAAPGPHALRPDEPADALAADLKWSMSRFGDYAGVANLLGGQVMSNATTMSAVLKATAARNLFFVDDGTSRGSLVPTLAPQLGIAATRADVVLDATSDPTVVRANLESLISIARRKGQAIGMASGLPEHLGMIASFAANLPSQNIALVPVSALVRPGASVATINR